MQSYQAYSCLSLCTSLYCSVIIVEVQLFYWQRKGCTFSVTHYHWTIGTHGNVIYSDISCLSSLRSKILAVCRMYNLTMFVCLICLSPEVLKQSRCRAKRLRERPRRSALSAPPPMSSPCLTSLRFRSSRRPSTWSTRTAMGLWTKRIFTTCSPPWVSRRVPEKVFTSAWAETTCQLQAVNSFALCIFGYASALFADFKLVLQANIINFSSVVNGAFT